MTQLTINILRNEAINEEIWDIKIIHLVSFITIDSTECYIILKINDFIIKVFFPYVIVMFYIVFV